MIFVHRFFQHDLCVVYSKFSNSTINIRLEEFNTQNSNLILCSKSLLRICILLDLTGASNGIGMSAYELNVRARACSAVLCFRGTPTGTASGSSARAQSTCSHSRRLSFLFTLFSLHYSMSVVRILYYECGQCVCVRARRACSCSCCSPGSSCPSTWPPACAPAPLPTAAQLIFLELHESTYRNV